MLLIIDIMLRSEKF